MSIFFIDGEAGLRDISHWPMGTCRTPAPVYSEQGHGRPQLIVLFPDKWGQESLIKVSFWKAEPSGFLLMPSFLPSCSLS